MILSKIIAENWQPFLGKHEVNIPRGLIRIQGRNLDNEGAKSNRSGKTAFLNTIPATLYNKTPLVARSNNLINENTDSANLQLEFYPNYSIKRYFRDKLFQNSIILGTYTVNQEEVEKSLGMNMEAFVSTVFFGTAYSDFLEKILRRPAEAKDLLISLLPNLQVFDIALEWIKKKILETEDYINSIERMIAVDIGKLESYQSMNYTTEIERYEQNRLNNISREEKEISNLEEELKSRKKESVPNLEIAYKKFLADKNYTQEKYNKKNSEYSTLASAGRFKERDITILKKEIEAMETGICPTCGQKIPKPEQLIKKAKEKLVERSKQMTDHNAKLDLVYKELEKSTVDLDAFSHEEKSFEKLRAINNHMLTLNNTIAHKKELIKKLKEDKNPYTAKEAEATKAMIEIQKEIGKLKTDSEVEKSLLQYYLFWEKGFGPRGIKNFIFDELIFRLTDLTQTYLDEMTEGTIQIRFDPRKQKKAGGFIETIGLEISSRGNPRDYFTWSASERKKVSLAVDLAMNQMLSEMFDSPYEFMVFDETFDGLDSVGVELFCTTLKKQLKRTPQIFVVSHIDLPDIFDHTITVVKENGQSRIENNMVSKRLLRRK